MQVRSCACVCRFEGGSGRAAARTIKGEARVTWQAGHARPVPARGRRRAAAAQRRARTHTHLCACTHTHTLKPALPARSTATNPCSQHGQNLQNNSPSPPLKQGVPAAATGRCAAVRVSAVFTGAPARARRKRAAVKGGAAHDLAGRLHAACAGEGARASARARRRSSGGRARAAVRTHAH